MKKIDRLLGLIPQTTTLHHSIPPVFLIVSQNKTQSVVQGLQ